MSDHQIGRLYRVPAGEVRLVLARIGYIKDFPLTGDKDTLGWLTKTRILALMESHRYSVKVAEYLGVNHRDFVAQGRSIFGGKTPQQALSESRKRKAMNLLWDFRFEDSPVQSVAEKMGLDRGTITHLIRKATDKTPRTLLKEWRESYGA